MLLAPTVLVQMQGKNGKNVSILIWFGAAVLALGNQLATPLLKKFYYTHTHRMSFYTSFYSKQPNLEPKLVSTLSETKRLFRLFRFYTETVSFGVSIEPKQT